MLHDFLRANRSELIERCRAKAAQRRAPLAPPVELTYGVPLFLDQLVEMLPGGAHADVHDDAPSPGARGLVAEQQLETGAARHGKELLRHEFTIDQVVHDYGDLCQAITQLANERNSPINTQEFGILNIKLDNAIAGAVTEYARVTRADAAASASTLNALVHELRNLHNTSIVAIAALRHGMVGMGGATSAALDRSMSRTGALLDQMISAGESS